MYPKRMCRVAIWAVFLTAIAIAFALLAGPAEAQEPTPCPWPTAWATAVATEIASTQRQTLIMRPVCAPATPAPAAAPAVTAQVETGDTGMFGLPLWYERIAGIVAIVGAVFLDILRRRALAARRQPRTLGEQMGVYERGGGGDNV